MPRCIGHDGSHCQTCKAVSWGLQFNATQKKDNCLVCVRTGSPKSNVFRTAFSLVKWPQIGGKSFSFRHNPNIKHQTHGNGSTPTSNLLTARFYVILNQVLFCRFLSCPPPGDSHGYPKIALENRLPMEPSIPFVGFRFQTVTLTFSECDLRPNLRPHWPSHSHRGYTHLSLAEGWGRAAARLVCPWVTLLAGWYRKCEEGAALRFGLKTTRSSSKILKWPRIGGENLRLTLETPVIGGKNHCFNRIQPFFSLQQIHWIFMFLFNFPFFAEYQRFCPCKDVFSSFYWQTIRNDSIGIVVSIWLRSCPRWRNVMIARHWTKHVSRSSRGHFFSGFNKYGISYGNVL